MNFKTITLLSAGLILAACSSTPEPVEAATNVATSQAIVPIPQPVTQAPVTAPAPITSSPVNPNPVQSYQGPTPGTLDDFLYNSGGEGRIFFGYDQYDLSNTARDSLRMQAQWLQTYSSVNAIIEGNADERGTREYNLALAARRAQTVKSFLVSQGVSPSRLTTVSYGKERPIDGRSNEDGWQRNRNAHTNLMTNTIG